VCVLFFIVCLFVCLFVTVQRTNDAAFSSSILNLMCVCVCGICGMCVADGHLQGTAGGAGPRGTLLRQGLREGGHARLAGADAGRERGPGGSR
jgi:hypothetical protein